MERTASGNGFIEVVPTPSCWAAHVEAEVRRARERGRNTVTDPNRGGYLVLGDTVTGNTCRRGRRQR